MTFRAKSAMRFSGYFTPIIIAFFFIVFPFWIALIFSYVSLNSANRIFYTISIHEDVLTITTLTAHNTYAISDLLSCKIGHFYYGIMKLRFSDGKTIRLYKPEKLIEFNEYIGNTCR